MLPIVTILGMDIGILLGGALFTESVFGLPGSARPRSRLSTASTCRQCRASSCLDDRDIALNLIVDLLYA